MAFAFREGMASKLAVCRMNDRIAPRFDQSPELVLVTLDDSGAVQEKKVLPIGNLKPQEVADLLSRLDVKILICGGVKEASQQALKKFNIALIDNVIGDVDDVLTRYSQGKLSRGNTVQ